MQLYSTIPILRKTKVLAIHELTHTQISQSSATW